MLFALLIPMLFAMAAIVLDIGNMYVHKKHNQTLVDAGAFAGATKFVGCSFQFGDPDAANEAIKTTALQYAGDTYRSPGTYNLQVQKPDDVRVVINSARYWAENDVMDGVGLDFTLDHDGDPATAGDPCSSKTLDVKATDHDVPLLTSLFPIRPDAKSKARVEIKQIKEQNAMLPWAVPDVEPAAVAAIFVDENTGDVIATQDLMKQDDVTLPFSEWTTSPVNSFVDLAGENTGVVILVSKVRTLSTIPALSLSTGGPGTLTNMCTQDPGLVTCYAGDGNQDGLTFVHGWSSFSGSPSAPQIRDVSIFKVDCEEFSAPYFMRSGEECTLGAEAVIDFGFDPDPRPAPPTGISAVVKLRGPGCGNNGCNMGFVGEAVASNESIWRTTEVSTIDPDPKTWGRQNYSIEWQTEFPVGITHSDTFGGVAHPYVADAKSGPVDYLKITTPTGVPGCVPGPIPDPNSREILDDQCIVVTVGVRKPLRLEDPLQPPILLRVASPSGSQNQAFDCDKTENFQNEIENGCKTTYALNYDDWSTPKDGVKEWADILCDTYGVGDLPPDTIVAVPPDSTPICVAIETGDKIGQFRQGLAKRFENPTCWPNNWPEDQPPAGRGPEDDEVISDFFKYVEEVNDPRYVTLIITDYGTFAGQGNDQVPVKYFAGFYATGWDVVGNVKACLDNDPHPWYGENYRRSLDNGDVWGHFVNIVKFSSAGKANEELCNFDELGNCIAVLVE